MIRWNARAPWLACVVLALGGAVAFGQKSDGGLSLPLAKARALLDAARVALESKDLAKSADALEEAALLVREAAPLVIPKAVVVSAPPEGLGVYQEAPGGRVRDRHVWLYVEVAGFGRRALHPRTSEVELSVSGAFSLEDGTPIGTMSLGKHAYRTHTPHALTFFGPNVKLSDKAPAGAYLIDLTVTDAVTKKEASTRVRFVIPD